jgi:hypothetical protein
VGRDVSEIAVGGIVESGETSVATPVPMPYQRQALFFQERGSCIILVAMLKTRPIQVCAFGRGIFPVLCGLFPGFEYVFTIDG